MNKEISVLRFINSEGFNTQRDIAKQSCMSLGQVNTILKGLVNRGFIRVETTNARTVKYNLTTLGIKEKATATYKSTIKSIGIVKKIEQSIDDIIEYNFKSQGEHIILIEKRDEICNIITKKLDIKECNYILIRNIDELSMYYNNKKCLAIAWDPGSVELFIERNIQYINILDKIYVGKLNETEDDYENI